MEKIDNEIIARFMGIEPTSFINLSGAITWKCGHTTNWASKENAFERFCHDVGYERSLDSLIPVLYKIAEIAINSEIPIVLDKAAIVCNAPICNSIKNHHQRAVDFIKWYNGYNSHTL